LKTLGKKIISVIVALLFVANAATARRLVFIGLDGWAGNTYETSDMPYTKQLANEGALTLEKRAVLPSSSAVNWASIFMGVGPEVHGYLNWGSKAPEMQQPSGTVTKDNIFPTVFQEARRQHPDAHMAYFYEWDGMKYLADTLAFNHHEQTKDGETAAKVAAYIKANKPDVAVAIFNNPDHAGHSKGWGSPEYYAAMTELDKYVACIVEAVKEAGLADETTVMITGDHGGINKGHGSTSMDEINSPLVLWGSGVRKGVTITDMVMGYDLAATMAQILDVDIPDCWRGRNIAQAFDGYLPKTIFSGLQGKHHVQGIAVDKARGHVYFSFTTRLIKTDMAGNLIGSVDGLTGHLGCLTFNEADGKVYGSLEYKNDEIGRGIAGDKAGKRENAVYIAMFEADKIVRPDMKPEDDDVMQTVYLADVVKDYNATVKVNGKSVEHRYGCSGIDGVAFAPRPGEVDGNYILYVAYGIYGDTGRSDNDYQVLLTYDTRDWSKYAQPLEENRPHHSGPAKALGRYFVYTGNTSWGIQNLCYDPSSRTLFAAVYKGKKAEFPNYSLFAIDLSKGATKERLKGFGKTTGLTLPLKELGSYDAATGIYGWDFPYGSTGICALGDGLFYISHNSRKPEQSSTLHLYKWDGGTAPFRMK